MRNILVIGGAGFIGANIADRFARMGDSVTIFDNFSRLGSEPNVAWLHGTYPGIKVIRADIVRDITALNDAVASADIVIHLAAQVAVTTSVIDPRQDFEINAIGTFNVLEAVRVSPTSPILLFSSTNKVYGCLEHIPLIEEESKYVFADSSLRGIDETTPLDFHSPYGCSKGAADQYVHDYSRIYKLRTIVFRQSCIYGERQFGIEDQGWVAWFLIAREKDKPITIYGNGKQVRDVLSVQDLGLAYELALKNINTTSGQIYNIGGGLANTVSILEFIAIVNGMGKTITASFASERPGDQKIFVSNNSKAKADFGWEPAVPAEEGIRRLSRWVRENRELFG